MSSYNLDNVKEMAGDDQDFLKIIVQTFLEEIPSDLNSMNEAVASGNPEVAYQYAHKMKPNLAMFGLDLMPEIRTIEDWSKTGGSEEKVDAAAAKITAKVKAAEKDLKADFEL